MISPLLVAAPRRSGAAGLCAPGGCSSGQPRGLEALGAAAARYGLIMLLAVLVLKT
jgi:hypothetical protein